MATLDVLFPGLTVRLIDRFGAMASLEVVTKTDDLVSGNVTETVVSTEIKITPPEPFTVGLIDGSLVEAGDMTSLVAARDLTARPAINRDRLVFALESWQIVAVDPIYSGDTATAYRLQLRT